MVNVSCIYRIKCESGSDAERVADILSKNNFLRHDNFSFRTVRNDSGVDTTIFKITLHGGDSVYKLANEIESMIKPVGIWQRICNYFSKL